MRSALPSPKSPPAPETSGGLSNDAPKDDLMFDLLPEPEPVDWDEAEPEATEFQHGPEDDLPDLKEWPLDDDPATGWSDPTPDNEAGALEEADRDDTWDQES
jgi:hypothetical protein